MTNSKQIFQFRYESDDNTSYNWNPIKKDSDIKAPNLYRSNNVFNGLRIYQLGIQALPGTKFYINGSTAPVVIGSTGIYELDLNSFSPITSLRFDPNSITAINGNASATLLIDMIAEKTEENGG